MSEPLTNQLGKLLYLKQYCYQIKPGQLLRPNSAGANINKLNNKII